MGVGKIKSQILCESLELFCVVLINSYRYTPSGPSPKEEEFFYKRKRTGCSHRSASAYGNREASDPHHPSCSEAARVHAEHQEPQGGRAKSLLAFFAFLIVPLYERPNSGPESLLDHADASSSSQTERQQLVEFANKIKPE